MLHSGFGYLTEKNFGLNSRDRLHIGHLIKAVFEESGLTVMEFARRIHCTHSNVYSIFERQDIGVEQLVNISIALKHNFFEDVQRKSLLDLGFPVTKGYRIDLNIKNMNSKKIDKIELLLDELVDVCR